MNQKNNLLLITGGDVPFIEAQLTIHQPRMKEIALISEEVFFKGYHLLTFSKEKYLSSQDKTVLEDTSDFEIFMSIMAEERISRDFVNSVLTLLFPQYEIKILKNDIIIYNDNISSRINQENFDAFKQILASMFDIESSNSAGDKYNPADKRAAKIAEKLNKHKEKVAQKNNETNGSSLDLFERWISILTVGESKNMNDFAEYTVYQLFDEYQRFQLKQSWQTNLDFRLAGATDLDEVDNWMKNIHS